MHVLAKLTALACAIALLLTPGLAHASPPSNPPAPCIEGSLTLTGTNLWQGLKDSKVSLTLRNGEQVSGTIVAQDDAQLALARAADGSVVAVPKGEIEGVRLLATSTADSNAELPPIAQRPLDDGRKAYGAGVAMLLFGVPFGVSGTVMLAIAPSALYIHLPLLLPGIGLTVGGSIALKRSYQRQENFRRAWGLPKTSKLQLAPTFNLNREGGQVGLVLRF